MSNRSCCLAKSIDHACWFSIFLLLTILVGGITGARYLQLREFTCLSYEDGAPKGNDGDITNQVMKIQDPTGYQSLIGLETGSIQPDLPRPCWSDGYYDATFINPKDVRDISLIVLGSIIGIYLLIQVTLHCHYYTESEYEGETEELFKDIFRDDITHRNTNASWQDTTSVVITLSSLCYIVSLIVLAVIFVPARHMTCTHYEKCSSGDNLVRCVKYHDNNGKEGLANFILGTYQPTNLPQDCWLKDGSVTFYSYSVLGWGFTGVFGGIVISLILFFYPLFLYREFLRKKIPVQQNNIELPQQNKDKPSDICDQKVNGEGYQKLDVKDKLEGEVNESELEGVVKEGYVGEVG